MLICTKDKNNYIGQTEDLRLRSNNSKTMVRYSNKYPNIYPAHFKNCSKLKDPYFYIYPFYYVEEEKEREFIERRFINKFKPTLNGKK